MRFSTQETALVTALWLAAFGAGAAAHWVYQRALGTVRALRLWLRTAEYRRH